MEVFPVITRAQSKKKLKEIEAHELATAQSQVVLTPPQQEPVAEQASDLEVSNVCEDAGTDGLNSSAEPGDCEAETRQEPQRNTVITKQQLLQEQQQDDETVKFIRESADEDSPFMVIGDILYWKKGDKADPQEDQALIVVPKKLKNQVLQAGHDFTGHFGSKKSKTLIQAHFWWPGMGRDIVQYCKACEICQRFNNKKTRKEPLCPLPVIDTPWSRIAIDIVGKFERTKKGNAYILTIMDFATRYMEAIPLPRIDAATHC